MADETEWWKLTRKARQLQSGRPASQPGQSPQAAAESERGRAEQRAYSSRKLGPVLVLLQPPLHPRLHHFSSLTLTLPLSSTSTSCAIIRPDPHLTTPASPCSLSVAPHPPICPASLVLLYYTHPRRQPILERRIVQPPLQLIIVTASGQSSCPVLPQRVQKYAFDPDFSPRELDLPGLVHGTIFVFAAALLPTIETAPHTISATRRL